MATNSPIPPGPATKPAAGPGAREDQLLAHLLTVIWATRTGRTLPPGPVSDLSPEELMDFWADDQLEHLPSTASHQTRSGQCHPWCMS